MWGWGLHTHLLVTGALGLPFASGLLSFALALTLALAFVSAGCPRSPRRLGSLRRLAGSVRTKAGLPTLDRCSGGRSATIFVIGSHGLGLGLGHS